jgi:threonylcarbamoyladenosine tRNA methylthiotransferase CDKAL1
MIDIEDMEEPIRRMPLEQVEVKRIKQRGINESQGGVNDILPGTSSIFLKTWGCGHNNSDGEYMAGILADYGYNVILDHSLADNADLWVLNSCTVKGPSEQTFVNDIDKAVGSGKKVVVAGCVPQGSPRQFQQYSIVGVQQIDQIVHVVEETLRGNIVQLLRDAKTGQVKLRKAGGAKLDLPKIRRNQFIEIIPVNTGCLNQCTYCKTKHARGDLGSYEIDEIVDRVNSVLDQEVLEIWLTSEDIGAYGKDIGVSIVDLLWKIVHAMENHPSKTSMLRIGMTNPPYIKEHVEEMAKILAHPRVYSFLHIPVQAGCDKVLTDMRRLYVIEDFEFIVNYLRDKVPGITIATDIICGNLS